MSINIKNLEDRLWEAADHMRANSSLRLNEFAEPVLGLIFLKFAGVKFSKTGKEIADERKTKTKSYGGASVARERPVSSADYHAQGTLFVPEKARFSYLIELPEGTDMGKAVNDAMKEIATTTKLETYYKCTHCGDEIFWNTHRKLTHCKCKKIWVDGCEDYVRVGGKEEDRKVIKK